MDIIESEKMAKPLRMYKFRSMVTDADKLIERFTPEQKREYEQNYKLENDPRITRVGKFLRATSLDELPQLVNVLKGELSLVGPRPVVEDELAKYGENADKFLSVTPGVTGYCRPTAAVIPPMNSVWKWSFTTLIMPVPGWI